MSIKLMVILILLASELAQASVLVAIPGANAAEAKAYATAHDRLILSDYLDATRPGETFETQLKTRLEKAQRAWLGSEIETARTEFRALTELALKADWREAHREVIQTAFLRLAQTSESMTERDSWLESAARLYSDLTPSPSLFPPPLLKEYASILARVQTTAVDIDLRDVFPDFRYALVDGRRFEIATASNIRLSKGLHRLSAYSDSHEPVTEFLTASQLRVLRLSPPTLTQGRCETAKLMTRANLASLTKVEIYSGAECPTSGLRNVDGILDSSRLLTLAAADPRGLTSTSFPSDGSGAKNKTWIWVVGGALLAGAAYALTKQPSATQPVHRSGF